MPDDTSSKGLFTSGVLSKFTNLEGITENEMGVSCKAFHVF